MFWVLMSSNTSRPPKHKWVSKWLFFSAKCAIFSYVMERTSNIRWDDDDDIRLVLEQHSWLDFYSAISPKQKFTGRYVTPLGHIILILRQPPIVLTP